MQCKFLTYRMRKSGCEVKLKFDFFQIEYKLLDCLKVVKQYTFIIVMTTFLSRQHNSYSVSNSHTASRKKIKHYSYSSSDRIGKGYSSIVYLGKNDNTDEVVAIKAIDMKGVKDAVSREMLDCQIQALTKLKHPNILRCFDVVRQTSFCYIITEYCQQGDLSSLLKKKRKMTENQVFPFMKDIVNGFVEIGENKFLHRDLKLANIFVSEKGVAKIADFGFAKKSYSSSQKEKYNVGSPLYMSPQALKKNIYSIKNDIWSIGIMIYQLLHGQTPWECKTEAQLIDKMTKIPVKFKSHVTVSQNLKEFIKKCLQVDQAKRMSLNDLKQWCFRNNQPRSHSLSQKHIPALGEKKYSGNEIVHQNKPIQSEKVAVKPLGDATNRFSMGVEKNRSYSNVMTKFTNDTKNISVGAIDKQNYNTHKNQKHTTLNKALIDKNNAIILIQINKFRLMFKIYQKVKKQSPEETTLHSVLGNEILGKVQNVADVILKSGEELSKKKAERLGIKQLQSYTRQEMNPGIKKYVAVIKEYQKKYNNEVQVPTTSNFLNCNELLRKYLNEERVNKNISKQENLLYYWVYELLCMTNNIKKEELDSIIEGKKMMPAEQLASKIKDL